MTVSVTQVCSGSDRGGQDSGGQDTVRQQEKREESKQEQHEDRQAHQTTDIEDVAVAANLEILTIDR